ncbi:hypothetical protein D9M68_1002780 [compost metagenome]
MGAAALEFMFSKVVTPTAHEPPRANKSDEPAGKALTLMPVRFCFGAVWVPGLALLPGTQAAAAPAWQSEKW